MCYSSLCLSSAPAWDPVPQARAGLFLIKGVAMQATKTLDVIIIGGGIGGVISLYYAKRAGVKALVLEKEAAVGGLWRQLPAWQDIQIAPLDWTLGDLPIAGADQQSILCNIQAWVDRFDLAPFIKLQSPVTKAAATEDGWTIETPTNTYRSRFLICASGGHNRPFIPPVERSAADVIEFHSALLKDPGQLTGRDVVVVGGGASAYDLLDLCFERRARRVMWAHRAVRWMVPTRKPKHQAGGIRELARQQMSDAGVEALNASMNLDLKARYDKFGLNDILPDHAFDIRRDQLIPGRACMISHFSQIDRRRAEVLSVQGRTVTLSSHDTVEADVILWGTGYEMDLRFLDSPVLAGIRHVNQLARRCGALFHSLDMPRLFFLAVILETTGSAPWAYAHAARTIAGHIRSAATLDEAPLKYKINHYDLLQFLAPHDPVNYPADSWHRTYQDLALSWPDDRPMPVP